jgi:hypothetical protein
MKNRISLAPEPQDVADFIAAQATQKRILLKWLKGVDLTELGPGNNMGTEGGWTYCKDGLQFATEYPKIYDDEEFDYDEYKKDIDGAALFINLKKGTEETDVRTGIILSLLGKDAMEQTHYIRKRGNDKRDKNLDYVAPSDKLNALFEKRTSRADETKKVNDQIKALQDQLAEANKTVEANKMANGNK